MSMKIFLFLICYLIRLPNRLLMHFVRFYQLILSPSKEYSCACRTHLQEMSCSAHAFHVLDKNSLPKALFLIFNRSRKCWNLSKKNGFSIKSSYFSHGFIVTSLALVTGCGSGGKEPTQPTSSTTTTSNTIQTINSADNQNKIYLTGTVAIGKAVSNATVHGTCRNGTKTSVIANNLGIYSGYFDGALPCILESKLQDNSLIRSLAIKSGQANINTFTEVQYILANGDASKYYDSQKSLYSSLSNIGVNLSQDPVITRFNTDRTGIDASLDQFKEKTVDNKSFAGSISSYNLAVNNFVALSDNGGYTKDGSLSFYQLIDQKVTSALYLLTDNDAKESYKLGVAHTLENVRTNFLTGAEEMKNGFANWFYDTSSNYSEYYNDMESCIINRHYL